MEIVRAEDTGTLEYDTYFNEDGGSGTLSSTSD
jgi:hypothetical protein